MDDTPEDLTVQGKFGDVARFEEENKVWNRLVTGLPVGQLSFILRAGVDCLTTPLNGKRWSYRADSNCHTVDAVTIPMVFLSLYWLVGLLQTTGHQGPTINLSKPI